MIDFHSHYFDAGWFPSSSSQVAGPLGRSWSLLTDIDAQLATMQGAGIDAKVLSAPIASLTSSGVPSSIALMGRINDRFASLVAAHPDRLLGLASIDVFLGEAAAREVERAVHTLRLPGICVDCAKGDLYLDAPEARPTLEVAAALDIPIFVHPVSPMGLTERLARFGHVGVLLARGTEDAASVLALLRSSILDDLPDLRIVIPMIGVAALLFAGMADQEYGREEEWRGERPSEKRKRLFIDTMCFDPVAIQFAIDLLGAEHVLLGSDWPIMPMTGRQRIEEILAGIRLSDAQRTAITGGNTVRLLTRRSES